MLGVTNVLTPLSYANAVDWYDALSGGALTQPALTFKMPDRDVYLKAITEANHYFVKYNGNTHTSWTMGTGEFVYDTPKQLSGNEFVKTWYTFSGWNTEAWGGGTSYADKATVDNWTTVENDVINIFAQWKANLYNIVYNLNDNEEGATSTAVHSRQPSSLAYDQTWDIANPTRTWYTFSGWDITNMDSESHIVGWVSSNATTANGVMWTGFKNLRASSGDVNFKAIWSKNLNTKYDVEHYLEKLEGWYGEAIEIDHLSWTTDEEVTPAIHSYTWFTARASDTPSTQNIKADGSTVFQYHYTRDSYDLTLTAGRWVESVKWTGSQNTTGGSTNGSTTISFKYDEPVKLSFTLKSWYTWGTWSGYEDTASSFNMPAFSTGKTAYATPIVYQLKVNPRWGNGATDRTTYTVEDADIPLGNLTRDHSEFLWWTGWVNGEWISSPEKDVVVASWSIDDREYSAVWSCITWYHLENTGASNEMCSANTDTKYLVNHIQQHLDWSYTIYIETGYKYGETNKPTAVTGRSDAWFELSGTIDSYNKNIEPDGSTVVNIYYKRLSYAWTVNSETWVTSPSAVGNVSGDSPFKYEDTVTLSATVEPGYTWVNWTVQDASWNNITVTDTTPGDPNGATFVMPANGVTITPHVTRDTYTIQYELYSWHEQSHNPTSYNVEDDDITLDEPARDHSVFLWWTGWVIDWEQLSWTTNPVIIAKWSVWNRKYYAVWACATWYHAVGTDSCVQNDYTVTIDYNDDGDTSWTVVNFKYDDPERIPEPSQSWYDFAWWTIEWMSGWVEHKIGNTTTTADSATGVKGEEFKNLTTENGWNVTFVAQWTPRTDTKYVVEHYTQNLDEATYTKMDTVEYSWSVAEPVQITSITTGAYSWFSEPTVWYLAWGVDGPSGSGYAQVTIDKHGTTVIKLFYSRNNYNVYLSGDAHVDVLVGSGSYPYGADVTVTATAKTWYHFKQWVKKKDINFDENE